MKQAHMFPTGADLPLFSQTAPKVKISPFEPKIIQRPPDQPALFELSEAEATERFRCPYCGYECDVTELGGEWDCPLCGDN